MSLWTNPWLIVLFYLLCTAGGLWGGYALMRRKARRLRREREEDRGPGL
ncbi:MAG: hypothetical protein PW734_03060 [Verrucomicrobium sp.]|nr:hypothetical protein [Verrucomicrobium sp.]